MHVCPAVRPAGCPSPPLSRTPETAFPTFVTLGCTLDETLAAADEWDRSLVQRFLDGDRDAANDLVDRYQRRLFNVSLRMLGNQQDAEDVTQTVFGNVFLSLSSYDSRFRFFSWIYRMTVNESLNAIKRRKQMVTLEDHLAIPTNGIAADDALEVEEHVSKALMQLKPDDRAVVVLRHFASFSHEEIAEVLDVPARTVKSRLFTACERLRSLLIAQGH